MRNLNLDEISEKISDYSSDIIYSDRENLEIKITQFINFLLEQPISKRTLERISDDFNELNLKRIEFKTKRIKKEFLNLLTTREKQGAFSYFEIIDKFKIKKKYSNHFIELSKDWYRVGGSFDKYQEKFNTFFFEPFIELLDWYFRESKIQNEKDFFSREEIDLYNSNFENLKKQITKLEFGQEIIFNETDEIKLLISGLNKKNWKELIKGKFNDMIIGGIINIEMAELLIETITGEKIHLK